MELPYIITWSVVLPMGDAHELLCFSRWFV